MKSKTPPRIKAYIEEVRSHLHLEAEKEVRVLDELYTHFQEKMAELKQQGLSEEEAEKSAIRSFGRARVFARLMYEAYGRGSWREVGIAIAPHLIVASLFALHLWRHPIVAPAVFLTIVAATLLGWWKGKPNWMYSWIGYSLFPLLVAGYQTRHFAIQTLLYLFRGQGQLAPIWILLLLICFYALSIWLIASTTARVVKRDWILATLMLVPLPILGIWLYNIEAVGGLFQKTKEIVFSWDSVMMYAFGVIGAASAFFIRFRQRLLKIVGLVSVGTITGAVAAYNIWGDIGFFWLLAISVVLLLFLLSPALLRASLGNNETEDENRWSSSVPHSS